MKLSKNFTLYEFTKTRYSNFNNPSETELQNLKALVENVIQPARDTLQEPITVTSGYRCEKVNKAAGGVPSSQHVKGEAADIISYNNKKLFDIIREQGNFDQLIWEYGNDLFPDWVHVSYSRTKNRNNVLRAIRKNGKTEYIYI